MSGFHNNPRVLDVLVSEYNSCRGQGSRTISRTLLENILDIHDMSLEQMAELCNVSVSTFSRFLHSIGYSSYTHFRIAIENELIEYIDVHSVIPRDEFFIFGDALYAMNLELQADLETIHKHVTSSDCSFVVGLLKACSNVRMIDTGDIYMRQQLQCDLAVTGKQVLTSFGFRYEPIDTGLDSQSLLLIVNDNLPREALKITEWKDTGAKVVIMTRKKVFPGHEKCDKVLYPGNISDRGWTMAREMVFGCIGLLYKGDCVKGHHLI